MILTLRGTVIAKKPTYVIIDVAGIGYQVHAGSDTLSSLSINEIARLWTYEHIREDAHDVYGFRTEREHALFLQFVSVSGVGPKMALNILSLGAPDAIETHIERGDVEWLSTVPGVGKKTAQKIILELRGKLADVAIEGSTEEEEVVSALIGLGYTRDAARGAVSSTGKDDAKVEDRLRDALRELAR